MDPLSLVLMFALGILLSAAAGLRAFLPPFVLACAGGLGWIQLADGLQWMATPLAIGVFSVAIAVEVLADKFPFVDHCVDALHVVIKPAAGALAAAALTQGIHPVVPVVAAILAGGTVAGATHMAKASVRLGSSATTGGAANPFLSLGEDLLAIAATGGIVWGAGLVG